MALREVKLDLKDKKLLYLLDFNARMPYSQMAKSVGLSKQGAEYKVNNLIKKGVIKGFYPVINVPKLGYLYCRLCIVLQNASQEVEKQILDFMVNDKRFFWVFTAQGMYDILTVVWAKTIAEFQNAVSDLLEKYGKYIRIKNESITTDVIHFQHRYLLGQNETKEIHIKETKKHLTLAPVDKEILKLLCQNARIPLIRIAEQLSLSAKTVAYKIKNLETQGIIEGYRPLIDHHKLGYTYYKLWINIQYQNIAELNHLYNYITQNPLVLYIVKGVGFPEELDIEIMVKTNLELYDFIKDLKMKFPGLIGDYKTFMFMETKKVRYLPF